MERIMQNTNQGSPNNLKGGKNKFFTILVLFACIISALSGRQLLDTGTENKSSYESNNTINNNTDSNISNSDSVDSRNKSDTKFYKFRNDKYLTEHFEKHGGDFDYSTKEEYLAGANEVIFSDDALHKLEKEDGDYVYYLEETNEFVIVSTDGYIRTYFKPRNGIDYYNGQ